MLRTALQPRWLGLLAVVALVMVTFGWLGAWQLNVARDKGQAAAAAAVPHLPVAPVTAVLQPHDAFPGNGLGRRVTASGHYDAARQVVVTPRRLHGVTGAWVVTPLVVDGTGARLAVLRGFVRSVADAAAPPSGPVTVSGALAPSESPSSDATVTSMPPGEMSSVDLSALVNRWPGAVYNAFVFAASETPAPPASATPERVPSPVDQPGGLAWRNAAYAFQWWIFAAFALYMWVKMVREDARPHVLDPQPREAVSV